jgi:hypothetical protein
MQLIEDGEDHAEEAGGGHSQAVIPLQFVGNVHKKVNAKNNLFVHECSHFLSLYIQPENF